MGRVKPEEVSFQGIPFSESVLADMIASLERLMEQGGRKKEVAGRRLLALAKLMNAERGSTGTDVRYVSPLGGVLSQGEMEVGNSRRLLALAKLENAEKGLTSTGVHHVTPSGYVLPQNEVGRRTMEEINGRRLLALAKLKAAAEGSQGDVVHLVTRSGRVLPPDEEAEALLRSLGGGKKTDPLIELILKNADEVAESAKSQVLTRSGVRDKAAEAAKAVAETVEAPAARSLAQEAAEMGVGTAVGVGATKAVEKGAKAVGSVLGGGEAAAEAGGAAAAEGAVKSGLLGRILASSTGRFILTRALPAVGVAGAIAYLLGALYNKKVRSPLQMKVMGAQSGESIASSLLGRTREMMDVQTEDDQARGLVEYATSLERGMREAEAQRRFDVGKVLAANQGELAAASVMSRPSYGELVAMMEGIR
jgi:hypothetical protein